MGKLEELLIVALILLLLFGAKRIPELARSVGQAAKEVRKGFSGDLADDSTNSKVKQKATIK